MTTEQEHDEALGEAHHEERPANPTSPLSPLCEGTGLAILAKLNDIHDTLMPLLIGVMGLIETKADAEDEERRVAGERAGTPR